MANLRAAVSLHGDALRYLEIDGGADNLRVVRAVELPLSRGGDWLGAMVSLRGQIGKFPPISFGVPMRETMVRLIEYPKMPIDDAKQALQFDFDRHFTWSYSESAVDACEVEAPMPSAPGKMTMLVAACRNEVVSRILDLAERVNVKIAGIEPMSVALLRAVMGGLPAHNGAWYSFNAEPDGVHFAFVFNDNGIFYRSGTLHGALDVESDEGIVAMMDEVQRTMTFVGNQFKGVSPQVVVLSGLLAGHERVASVIESSTGLRTESVDVYQLWGITEPQKPGFESAFGLCLRDEV